MAARRSKTGSCFDDVEIRDVKDPQAVCPHGARGYRARVRPFQQK